MQVDKSKQEDKNPSEKDASGESQPSPILCTHCLRTATNGIKCQGICVADSNY
jgi:hypothetical protein